MPVTASSSAPRPSAWEWTQTVLLVANVSWTTLCLGGYRPETMVVSSALTCALLVVNLLERIFGNDRGASGASAATGRAASIHPAGWLLLPFLAYAAANVLWVTPVRWLGWLDWLGWAQMIAVFWVVLNGIRSRRPRRVLFCSLIALGVGAVLLGSYQRFASPEWLMLGRVQSTQFFGRASGPFGSPNSLAALLLLLLPVAGALALRPGARATERVWWGWAAFVMLFGLGLTISRGAWIGLALALTVWPLSHARWSWNRRALVAAGVLALVLVAGAITYASSSKVRVRFIALVEHVGERSRPIMWRASWELFREHPAWGSGAGSYNVLFDRHRPDRFPDEPQWAHNDYLNTLSDYGAAGFILFFGACGAIALRCRRGPAPTEAPRHERDWLDIPVTRRALAIGMLAFAIHLFVDFHLKIPALAMAFAIVAGLVVSRTWTWPPRVVGASAPALANSSRRGFAFATRLASGAAVLGVMAGGWAAATFYRGEAARYQARRAIDRLAISPPDPARYRERLERAQAALERAVALAPSNGQAWADLAYATALFSHVEPHRGVELGRRAEAAAERALAYSKASYEAWVRRGVARDMQGRWVEAGADFAEAVKVAPRNAFAWYYQAEHLSRKTTARPLAEAALAFCLRLDPWNPPGLALRQRLAVGAKAQ